MNYLAHLFLGQHDEDILLGNFIADGIRNRELPNFSDSVQRGIWLHRRIDDFTDRHPLVREGTRVLHPTQGKYAPVVIDVYFDFLLARNWSRYTNEPYERFADRMYDTLRRRHEDLPTSMQRYVPKMLNGRWLDNYRTLVGLQFTFERLERRVRFPNQLQTATTMLERELPFFDDLFQRFFPDVQRMVADWIQGEAAQKKGQ